jgi:hypothetical protein
MRLEKIIKIAGLNLTIAIIDIIIFSPGLLDIQVGGTSVFATAFGVTAILMSGLVFVYGNFKLLFAPEKIIIPINEIKTAADCIDALKQNYVKGTFSRDIDTILEQIERLLKKKETIKEILLQKFDSSEMSYQKFQGAVADAENIFYMNIKSILNKLNSFDEKDYIRIQKNKQRKFSQEFIRTKMSIYNEYISFVKNSIEDNEQILLKLDKFLLEISKFNSLENGEIENAMKEIDELINKTKFYN